MNPDELQEAIELFSKWAIKLKKSEQGSLKQGLVQEAYESLRKISLAFAFGGEILEISPIIKEKNASFKVINKKGVIKYFSTNKV